MHTTRVAVVGAGQAGLAVSRLLTGAGVEHVVLEQGEVADRWRTRGWDSLRLLTPRWMSRLPHWSWTGPDPHGYMTRSEVVDYLTGYAATFAAPVVPGAKVLSLHPRGDGFALVTTAGTWCAQDVVLATGHCAEARVPDLAASLAGTLHQVTADLYRRPAALPDGGVLVVGASASGVQVADELRAAGRDVLLAVGNHTRLPRLYRGRDVLAWLSALGTLDRERDSLPDPALAPHEPSMQLVGRDVPREMDLATLQSRGVRLAGRLTAADGARVGFADDLVRTTRDADRRLARLLARVDALADAADAPPPAPAPPTAARVDGAPTTVDLRAEGIRSVVWATGHRRPLPWLHVPVLGPDGEVRQRAGRTPVPGLWVVGAAWQTRRSSSMLDGVRHDAALVVDAIVDRLAGTARLALAVQP